MAHVVPIPVAASDSEVDSDHLPLAQRVRASALAHHVPRRAAAPLRGPALVRVALRVVPRLADMPWSARTIEVSADTKMDAVLRRFVRRANRGGEGFVRSGECQSVGTNE